MLTIGYSSGGSLHSRPCNTAEPLMHVTISTYPVITAEPEYDAHGDCV